MKLSRHSLAVASVGLAVAIACSSCGSSAPSLSTVQGQLLAIVKSTDNQLAKDTTQNHLARNYAEYAQVFAQAARQFKALPVPTSARHADDTLVADLNTMSRLATVTSKAAAKNQNVEKNVLAYGQANLKLMEAETTEKKASNALRKALGLPPEATTTTTAPSTTIPVSISSTTLPG
jgi:hypothetical protein